MLQRGEFQSRSTELGERLHARLRALIGHGVLAVRGMGLWAGVDIDPSLGTGKQISLRLAERGVLVKDTHGSTLRFAPPLVITAAEIDWAIDQFAAVLADASSHSMAVQSSPTGGTMTAPSLSFTQQMLRRRPVVGAPVAHGASEDLKRSIGTFQLTHVRRRRHRRHRHLLRVVGRRCRRRARRCLSRLSLAGVAAGLAAICYAEMASAVPVSGSTYSYAYTTMGEFVAMGVAACLLLEYGVSIAAVAVGWSGYLNKLLDNLFGWQLPQALTAAPWDADAGHRQPTGGASDRDVHVAADPRRKRVG